MGKNYKQLTLKDREVIDLLLRQGKSHNFIAKELGVHRSTITREINRHTGFIVDFYLASRADFAATSQKKLANSHKRLKNQRIIDYVRNKLLADWSPELISGRIKIDLPELSISHEAIYQYIYTLRDKRERSELIGHLARSHRNRRRKFSWCKLRQVKIPNRVSIEKRPQSVNLRKQPGHWEGDILISRKSKVVLNSLTERKTRLLFLTKLPNRNSQITADAVTARLKRLPKKLRRTLTLDNGTENALHERITQDTGTRCFFAHPYSAHERGSNEHINGLVRRYLPKGTDFAKISEEQIQNIEKRINQRPRKCLGFKKPLELASDLGVALRY